MYAQWRSVEDYQAMLENPAPLPYLQRALAIAKFDPGMYEVVETYSGRHQSSNSPTSRSRFCGYRDHGIVAPHGYRDVMWPSRPEGIVKPKQQPAVEGRGE
jgi:hypothetical protein